MKKLIILVMLMGLMFAGVDIKNEFRGNKFGVDISQLKEKGTLVRESDELGYGQYERWYQVKHLGRQFTVTYTFYNSRLMVAGYFSESLDDFCLIVDQIVATYGACEERDDNNFYWWSTDKKTFMHVKMTRDEYTGDFLGIVLLMDMALVQEQAEFEAKAKVLHF